MSCKVCYGHPGCPCCAEEDRHIEAVVCELCGQEIDEGQEVFSGSDGRDSFCGSGRSVIYLGSEGYSGKYACRCCIEQEIEESGQSQEEVVESLSLSFKDQGAPNSKYVRPMAGNIGTDSRRDGVSNSLY